MDTTVCVPGLSLGHRFFVTSVNCVGQLARVPYPVPLAPAYRGFAPPHLARTI